MKRAKRLMKRQRKAKQKATFFDLDGTWYRKQLFIDIVGGCVEEGFMPAFVLKTVEEARDLAKQRKIPYEDYIKKQVSAYQDDGRMEGIRVANFSDVCRRVIERKGHEVHVFTRELDAASRDIGMRRAIVSGSPHQAVEEFAKMNGIEIYLGTEHPFNKRGRFTGKPPVQHFLHKDKALRMLARKHHLDLDGSCAIGDSSSDAGMFEVVRYPICFNPEKKLLPLARQNRWPIVIEEKNVITVFKPGTDGRLVEVPLTRILPLDLAQRLGERLKATGWYQPYFETIA